VEKRENMKVSLAEIAEARREKEVGRYPFGTMLRIDFSVASLL